MTLVSLSNICQAKMKGSVLTVTLDFGDGFVASTTITFEIEAFGSRSYPPSNAAAQVHHQRSNLFQMIQGKFARLVHSKCKRVATIVIQSWIWQHHATETHRVTPARVMPLPHPFLDSQNGSGSDDSDDGCDGPGTREVDVNNPSLRPMLNRLSRRPHFDDRESDGHHVVMEHDVDDDNEESPEPIGLSRD